MLAYSVVASNDGHALAVKSRCPRILAFGNCTLSLRRSATNADFCSSVRVLRVFAVGGQTTDIADAYGMGVVSLAVRSHLCERSAMMHRAVAVDYEVISDGGKASLPVPAVDISRGEVLAFRRGRAMDDDEINLAHPSPPSVSACRRGTSVVLHT